MRARTLRILPKRRSWSCQIDKGRVRFKAFDVLAEQIVNVSREINSSPGTQLRNKNIDKRIVDDFAFIVFLLPPGIWKVKDYLFKCLFFENERHELPSIAVHDLDIIHVLSLCSFARLPDPFPFPL